MKTRHNKKRNTALVYEALIREATVSILKEEHETKNKVGSGKQGLHIHSNGLCSACHYAKSKIR